MTPVGHIHFLLNYREGLKRFKEDILERAGYQQNGTLYACEDEQKEIILRLADYRPAAKKEDIIIGLLGSKSSLESDEKRYNLFMEITLHKGSLSDRGIMFHYQWVKDFLDINGIPNKCLNPPQEERKNPHRMKVRAEGGLERELLAVE